MASKITYGEAIHIVTEDLKFKADTLAELEKYLKSKGLHISKDTLRIIWSKIHRTSKLALLKKWIERLARKGYTYLPEKFIVVSSGRKLKFYRPDILLISRDSRHIILVEIKSGKRYKPSQLRRYRKALEFNYPRYKIDCYVLLVGSNKLKKVKCK